MSDQIETAWTRFAVVMAGLLATAVAARCVWVFRGSRARLTRPAAAAGA
jgi:hypothetical protein